MLWTEPLERLVKVDEHAARAELADYDSCELGSLDLALHGLLQYVEDEIDRRVAARG